MKEWTFKYKVGEWAVAPLISGDTSGLDPHDEFMLDMFIGMVSANMEDGDYLSWSVDSLEPQFGRCDISGVYTGLLYDMTQYVRRYESQTQEA